MNSTAPAHPAPTGAAATGAPRVHGLDALRGFALLLGIVFHGLLGFVDGFEWVVADRHSSDAAAVVTYWAHSFRMPLFMLLAGYFARLSIGRRGTASFVKDRVKRIWLPLIAFWPFAVISIAPISMLSLALHPEQAPAAPPAMPDDPLLLISPGQLWFLWSLLQCYALILVLRAVARRVAPRAIARLTDAASRLLSGPGAPALAGLTLFAALLAQGRPAAVEGPMTIRPELPATLAFFGAFVVGWLLHVRPDALDRLRRGWGVRLVVATVLSGGTLAAIGLTPNQPAALPVPDIVLAAGYALAAWEWIYGLTGAALALLNAERPAVRYLADASYWMYLVHLPLVLLGAVLVADLTWPIPVKLLVILGAPIALMLASYDLVVRPTWLGAWLNGRRRPRVLFRSRRGRSATPVPERG